MPIITKRMQRLMKELWPEEEERLKREREEQERIKKEREERERLLKEYKDPVKVRQAMNKQKNESWRRTFVDVHKLDGPEPVTWEESLDRKGFKVDRTKHRGDGELSETYIGRWVDVQKDVCCKVLRFSEAVLKYKMKDPERQLKLLNNLSHSKLIRMIKIFEITQTKKIYIFMELAEKGSVSDIMVSTERPIDDGRCKKWSKDTAQGLAYLHSIGIAHRRIQAKNVLVNASDVAKLSLPDLFVEFFDKNTFKMKLCKVVGTRLAYCAPETLSPPYDPLQADVWAFGVLVFHMLTSKFPFPSYKGPLEDLKEEVESKHWSTMSTGRPPFSPAQKAVFERIFTLDTIKRPTTEETLALDWFAH